MSGYKAVGATKVQLLDGDEPFYDDDPYLHRATRGRVTPRRGS
ncbi:hypothetical protein AB0F91_45745 [Amycolatopsis sp. NPDC023774]